MKNLDLEDRLIQFASSILDIVDKLPAIQPGKYLGLQLMRSGTAPALMYGEEQSVNSEDAILDMQQVFRELHKTHVCLRLIAMRSYIVPNDFLKKMIAENDELLKIFVASIQSATGGERNNETNPV
jgi:four helix bundle protein